MAVPVKIADLNTTESSNSPSGSESVGVNLDNYLRAAFAILKQTQSKGSDIASSSTITIPDNGNYFVVTGTTTIAGINDSFNGRISVLKFSGALTLTNSASLILFGGDLTTAAGDVLTVVNESAGVYRAINYIDASAAGDYITAASTDTLTNKTIVAANNTITTAASGDLAATELDAALAELDSEKAALASPVFTGAPELPTGAVAVTQSHSDNSTSIATTAYVDTRIALTAEQATTSGRGISFTSIPAGVKRITMMLEAVSTTGATDRFLVRIGDAGGIETTGYISHCANNDGTVVQTETTYFDIHVAIGGAANSWHGVVNLYLKDATNDTWMIDSKMGENGGTAKMTFGTGFKSLTSALTQVQLALTGTTDDFDAGSVAIQYE